MKENYIFTLSNLSTSILDCIILRSCRRRVKHTTQEQRKYGFSLYVQRTNRAICTARNTYENKHSHIWFYISHASATGSAGSAGQVCRSSDGCFPLQRPGFIFKCLCGSCSGEIGLGQGVFCVLEFSLTTCHYKNFVCHLRLV